MIKRHIIWLSLLAGLLIVFIMPTHLVHASNTVMHLAEPYETVTIYDVTAAWYTKAPQNAEETMARQDQFVQDPPANKRLLQQVQADADLTAHFELPAKQQNRRAVYYLEAKNGQSVVIVMPAKASTLDIWPKELIMTPIPDQPRKPHHHKPNHPKLPDTGEAVNGLGMLGIVALMVALVVGWRQWVH